MRKIISVFLCTFCFSYAGDDIEKLIENARKERIKFNIQSEMTQYRMYKKRVLQQEKQLSFSEQVERIRRKKELAQMMQIRMTSHGMVGNFLIGMNRVYQNNEQTPYGIIDVNSYKVGRFYIFPDIIQEVSVGQPQNVDFSLPPLPQLSNSGIPLQQQGSNTLPPPPPLPERGR